MSIRHLDHLFDPASVAVIGASRRPGSVGATVWRNLCGDGFKGRRYAVNTRHSSFDGEPVYARATDLPEVPELAIVCTPPATVPGLIAELGAQGHARRGGAHRRARRGAAPGHARRGEARTCCASSGPTASACWCRTSA